MTFSIHYTIFNLCHRIRNLNIFSYTRCNKLFAVYNTFSIDFFPHEYARIRINNDYFETCGTVTILDRYTISYTGKT
jgi:hypothetical protein